MIEQQPFSTLPEVRKGLGCQQWEIGIDSITYSANWYSRSLDGFFHISTRGTCFLSVRLKRGKIFDISGALRRKYGF
jgi:hypothetical protein